MHAQGPVMFSVGVIKSKVGERVDNTAFADFVWATSKDAMKLRMTGFESKAGLCNPLLFFLKEALDTRSSVRPAIGRPSLSRYFIII